MSKNVLVFFSFRSHKYKYIEMLFERLSERAVQHGLTLHRGSLKDLYVEVKDGELLITESLTGKSLADFDAIYFELWYKAQQQALAAATFAEHHNIPYFSKEIASILPMTKLGELAKLAHSGVPLPHSFVSSKRETLKTFKKQPPFAFPFIMKAIDGYGGQKNFLVKDYSELKELYAQHPDDTFVLQEFIPNDCDYRCLVLGGEVKLVLKRTRVSDNTHLNNTSAGAEGEIVPVETLPLVVRQDAARAAAGLNRKEFAGVDVLINKDNGQHYILEVNQTPQIEIGAAVEQKMDALLTELSSLVSKGRAS